MTLTLTTTGQPEGVTAGTAQVVVTIPALPTADAGPNQSLVSSAATIQLAGSLGGSATVGTWSGGSGTFNPNTTTLNAVYTPSAKERAAGSWALTLTASSPLCSGTASSMSFTFIPQITLPLVTNNSSLNIHICLNPMSDLGGGNVLDLGTQCTNQTQNLSGYMTFQLDSISNPTQIAMKDFRYNAMAPYVMSLTWTLGSLVVPVTATVGTLEQPAALYDGAPGTGTPVPVNPDGSFTLTNVTFAVSALAYYGGTAEGSIDLSGQQIVMPELPGTIHITNEVATVHMDNTIVQTFYETGDLIVTGFAAFHVVLDAVGPTTVPRYMIWSGTSSTNLNGAWNTTDANWNHRSAIWDNIRGATDTAVFNSTGDPVVTLTEPITAAALDIEGPGYTIEGSSLSLANQAAITNNFDATISGAIVSGSLNKWGASKLTLSGANTYAGPTTVGQGILEYGAVTAVGSTSKITVQMGLRFPSPRRSPDRRSARRLISAAPCTPSCPVARSRSPARLRCRQWPNLRPGRGLLHG